MRTEATSRQVLCAARVMSSFLAFQPAENQRRWLERMSAIVARLEAGDRTQALALQANYFARFLELRPDAKRIVAGVLRNIGALGTLDRIDIQRSVAITLLSLGDHDLALRITREMLATSLALRQPNVLVKTLNLLGMILYGLADPEFAAVSEQARPLVSKAGAWRFSQASHWLPAEYYARCGDADKANLLAALHEDVILADGLPQSHSASPLSPPEWNAVQPHQRAVRRRFTGLRPLRAT